MDKFIAGVGSELAAILAVFVTMCSAIIVALHIHWQLTLIMMCSAPFIIWVTIIFARVNCLVSEIFDFLMFDDSLRQIRQ